MKKSCLLLLFFSLFFTLHAQWKWQDPMKAGFSVIQNQGRYDNLSHTYTRLPERAKEIVREPVWNLSRHSAGLAIHFYSDAPEVCIRYGAGGAHQMPHMPATGVSGIDLYAIDSDGQWHILAGNFSFRDTISYHFTNIPKDKYHTHGYEYRLYLPLYNSVEWMEIGVPEENSLSFIPTSLEKPLLVYGTSIAQGACASRPGMAWTTIVQRSLNYPLINLGFSGNGWMEPEMIDFLTETDPRIYILDCLPNLVRFEEEEITRRIVNFVRGLRDYKTVPILLVEHSGYSNESMDTRKKEEVEKSNRASRKAWEILKEEKHAELYYLTQQQQNLPAEGWVDYVHHNDWGMQQKAMALEKEVRQILQIPIGKVSTTQPVTQRREPHNYEWGTRHQTILEYNRNPPKTVILGNSITHFWGGTPASHIANGKKSWEKYMAPKDIRNMGYGWDRIENVLWRVYHGELDGYEAEEIIIMIGTNNKTTNTIPEIAEGMEFLLNAIRIRQPKATIKVIGLLPRREGEEWIEEVNKQYQRIAEQQNLLFLNPGKTLLQTDGKIDESLFTDGLHPNEKGYARIAPIIAGNK